VPTGQPPKYEPLRRYLVAQAGDTVTLTLPAIEGIIGAPLPPSARTARRWGNSRNEALATAWLDAGWRVARKNFRLAVPTVTFVRVASTA
jgi:hypothetical protein